MISAALVGVAALAFATTSEARKIEGFEAGDPAVTAVGDSGSRGTYQTVGAPTEGTVQYLITTIKSTDDAGILNQSGTNAASNATLNSLANFNGAAPLGIEGSAVFIPFSILSGDTTLSLQFDFLSNEVAQSTPRNDFAFYALFDSTGAQVGSTTTFVSVTNPGVAFTNFGAGSPFIAHTGYQTLSFSVASLAAGNYTLGIGIEDATNALHASGLLVDNVQIVGVPEPSVVVLAFAGAAVLFALRARIRRIA